MEDEKKKKNYTCEKCKNSYSRSNNLKRHTCKVKINNICRFCQQKFQTSCELSKHMRHSVCKINMKDEKKMEKKYTCEKCKNSYSRSNDLKRHTCKVKINNICCFCQQKFQRNCDLSKHMRHSVCRIKKQSKNSKKFQCPTCLKKFNRKKNMQMHTKTCGNELQILPIHHCSKCEKVFSSRNERQKHENKNHAGAGLPILKKPWQIKKKKKR